MHHNMRVDLPGDDPRHGLELGQTAAGFEYGTCICGWYSGSYTDVTRVVDLYVEHLPRRIVRTDTDVF